MSYPTPEQVRDAGRDATALLRAHLANDEQGMAAVLAGCDTAAVIHSLCGTTLQALESMMLTKGWHESNVRDGLDRLLLASLQPK